MNLKSDQGQGFSYKEKVLAHWGLLNRLAARRFSSDGVAEAAVLYVMEQLEEKDWKRVRKFSGRSRFSTFLASVVYRLLEDYSRKQFGRKKVPGWISAMGGTWLRLFRLLCLERFSFNDAISIAADRQSNMEQEKIELVAEKILGDIPDCGQNQYKETLYNEEAHSLIEGENVSRQQRTLEEKQKEQLITAVFQELLGTDRSEESENGVRMILKDRIDLSTEERLLLKLCHQDGLGVAEAGRMVGLSRYQVHGKMRRLYTRIRKAISDGGYESEIRLLLGD